MRLLFLFLSLLINSINSFAQTEWVMVRVGNELSVNFPQEPKTDLKPERRLSLYTFRDTETDCIFSVLVRGNAMPNYERIKGLSSQEKEINSFLDKGITQFIQKSKILTPSKAIRVGNFIGRELTYSQLNDKSGTWFTQNAKFVFANNNLYIIQCSIYKEDACLSDKNKFLNSITLN